MAGEGRRTELVVGLAALALRLVHNGAMMDLPLYQIPLGGHVAFLDEAERIAGGALVPERAFTENSPLFPYLLAAVFAVAGGRDLLLARVLGIAADTVTAVLVTRLANRRFGVTAGAIAGLLYAGYGPAVFFAAELIYIPYALLCATAAIVCLTGGPPTMRRMLATGVLYGLATGFMPSLLAGLPLLALLVAVEGGGGWVRRSAAAVAGVALAIAPVTALNYAASGRLVLLTMSSGHAFYLGHNPQARAGYYLPDRVGAVQAANRGSIFDSMHRIAEETAGRPMPPDEVSGFYFRKAVEHVTAAPAAELRLAASRLAAFANWYEATTYADFYFQRERSVVLRVLPGFSVLFALAVLGLAQARLRRELPLLLFPVVSLASVVLFFYLARFRMPATPFLCCFAGHGIARVIARVREPLGARFAVTVVAAGLAFMVASRTMVVPDTSNEWNKVGTLHLALKQYDAAEADFRQAATANPASPYPYLNLARVYDATGAVERAAEARAIAEGLAAGKRDGERFRAGLAGE
jgi:4-amino-4-deoxy-L-arabinose transferase-like glycosyltransferase